MKKTISILLILTLTLLLTSCSKTSNESTDVVNDVLMVSDHSYCDTLTLSTVGDKYYLTSTDREYSIEGTDILSPVLHLNKGDDIVATITVADYDCPNVDILNETYITLNDGNYTHQQKWVNDCSYEYNTKKGKEIFRFVEGQLYINGMCLYPIIELNTNYQDEKSMDKILESLIWTYTSPESTNKSTSIDSTEQTDTTYSAAALNKKYLETVSKPKGAWVYKMQIENDELIVWGSLDSIKTGETKSKHLRNKKRTYPLSDEVNLGLDWVGDKEQQIEHFNKNGKDLNCQAFSFQTLNDEVVSITFAGGAITAEQTEATEPQAEDEEKAPNKVFAKIIEEYQAMQNNGDIQFFQYCYTDVKSSNKTEPALFLNWRAGSIYTDVYITKLGKKQSIAGIQGTATSISDDLMYICGMNTFSGEITIYKYKNGSYEEDRTYSMVENGQEGAEQQIKADYGITLKQIQYQ